MRPTVLVVLHGRETLALGDCLVHQDLQVKACKDHWYLTPFLLINHTILKANNLNTRLVNSLFQCKASKQPTKCREHPKMGRSLKSKYDFFIRLVQFVEERACVVPVPASDDPLSLFTLPFSPFSCQRRRAGARCQSQPTFVSDEEQMA